jgi:hypothetical protein
MQTSVPGIIVLFLTTAAAVSAVGVPSRTPLAQLLTSRFGELSLSEEKLAQAAAKGETADCSELSGKDHIIRGDLLSWLCTDPDAFAQLTYRGISIVGAEIVNKTDLGWARISFPIRVVKCVFRDAIILNHSHIASFDLEGSSIQDLQAVVTHFEGDLPLRNGFKADGGVNLLTAKIDGNLDCSSGQFIGKIGTPALNANSVEVKGGVALRDGFKADGGVDLVDAKIDGNLDCSSGQFISKTATPALNANSVEVKGDVFLRDRFKADGGVDLVAAKIHGNLMCDSGQFISKTATPALNLLGAKIDGNLDCSSGQFIGKIGTPALFANSVEVKGGVALRGGFKADGGVDLVDAKIDGYLDCSSGQFISKTATPALNANSVEVKGGVVLRGGFKADGGVDLVAAKIDGYLDCSRGQFISKTETPALNADSAKIDGGAYFREGFAVEGEARFAGAYVGGHFQWLGVASPKTAILNLRSAKVGTLFNHQNSWPGNGNLFLGDFVYDQIDDNASPNADVQLGWLQRQPQNRFLSQPFEQLAGVLRKMGHDEDAKKVMIAKNESEAKHIPLRFNRTGDWIWFKIVGPGIGYGYRPWNALFASFWIIVIGTALFGIGFRKEIITPTSDAAYGTVRGSTHQLLESYPKFNAFIYSLETFVPLVKLGLGDAWTPNANRGASLRLGNERFRTGSLLRGYLWFHIISGWILTTLWVGGLTGLVKT